MKLPARRRALSAHPLTCAVLATLVALVTVVLAGCGGKSEESNSGTAATGRESRVSSAPAKSGVGRTVGVSLLKLDDAIYKTMQKAMEDAATANNITLDIQSADQDQGVQSRQVDTFIGEHVDAIVLCPVDANHVESAVRKANDAHIPVFTAGIRANRGMVVSHIGSDIMRGVNLGADAIPCPDKIGDTTIRTVAAYLRREPVPSEIKVETGVKDASNVKR
jgi:ribose transport system substrate-binding protein